MRTETKTITYYKINELNEQAKANAVSKLYDINLDHDWWESVYENAESIGCKILEFDTDRGSLCTMQLDYEISVIELILKEHGPSCDTYKIAKDFESKILDVDGNIDSDVAIDFKKALEEEYLSILRREFEYLTSEESIIETIEANGYEFDKQGNFI